MSRVTSPVSPNAVVWNNEGNVTMHHCKISVISIRLSHPYQERGLSNLEAPDSAVDGLGSSDVSS